MRLQITRDEIDWTVETNHWLTERVWAHDARSLYLPAGDTPQGIYNSWRRDPPKCLSRLRLLQLDDIAEGKHQGRFARYFREALPGQRVEEPLKDVQADLGILGLGTNGHVAFHEPGIPATFRYGEIQLQGETAARMGVEPGTAALTFGLAALAETHALLLLVKGEHKRSVLERLLKEDKALPATALMDHPDLTILTDIQNIEPR